MSWTDSASTRSLALVRISFAALIWGVWGTDLVLNYNLLPHEFVGAAVVLAASTFMLIGWWSRLACALTGASVAFMVVYSDLPGVPLWPDLHFALYIAVPLILALSPCGRSLSCDRWFALWRAERREAPAPDERGDVRALGVLLVLLIGAHALQALTMSTSPWLSGYTLERILSWQGFGSVPPGPRWSMLLAALPILAVLLCVLTWALAATLAVPKMRARVVGVGVLAQLSLYLLLPVGTGPLGLVVLYLSALDPDRVHAFIDAFVASEDPSAAQSSSSDSAGSSSASSRGA